MTTYEYLVKAVGEVEKLRGIPDPDDDAAWRRKYTFLMEAWRTYAMFLEGQLEYPDDQQDKYEMAKAKAKALVAQKLG